MTARRRRRAPPEPPPGGLLDWRAPEHWSWTPKPCRYCGKPAHTRDSKRKPAHKICAEQALAQQAADTAEAYRTRGTT